MSTRTVVLMALGALLATGGGVSTAVVLTADEDQRPASGVRACVAKRDAVVAATAAGRCPKGSRTVRVGGKGARGAPGTPGAPGPVGPAGPTGQPGTAPTMIDGGAP